MKTFCMVSILSVIREHPVVLMVGASAARSDRRWLFEWPTHDMEPIVDTVTVKTSKRLLLWITLLFEQEAERGR